MYVNILTMNPKMIGSGYAAPLCTCLPSRSTTVSSIGADALMLLQASAGATTRQLYRSHELARVRFNHGQGEILDT